MTILEQRFFELIPSFLKEIKGIKDAIKELTAAVKELKGDKPKTKTDMARKELIDKITNDVSFQERSSEFFEPYRVSRETLYDMTHDFYNLLLAVLNYLDSEDTPDTPTE